MSLSRRHFKDLADIVKETKRQFTQVHPQESPETLLRELEDNIAFFCKKYNPAFDYDKFQQACNLEGTP